MPRNTCKPPGSSERYERGSRRFFGHAKPDFGKRVTKPGRRAIQGGEFLTRVRRKSVQPDPALSPDFIDAVARRVLELSRRKLTVGDVARIYGVHPSWVYARADKLGAIRLGTGPKAPLRFDPDTIDDRFKALAAAGSAPSSCASPQPAKRATPVRRRRSAAQQIELLPVRAETSPHGRQRDARDGRHRPRRPS